MSDVSLDRRGRLSSAPCGCKIWWQSEVGLPDLYGDRTDYGLSVAIVENDYMVCVATDLDDSAAASVSHCSCELATLVCKTMRWSDPHKFAWFEHLPDQTRDGKLIPGGIDRVEMGWADSEAGSHPRCGAISAVRGLRTARPAPSTRQDHSVDPVFDAWPSP